MVTANGIAAYGGTNYDLVQQPVLVGNVFYLAYDLP